MQTYNQVIKNLKAQRRRTQVAAFVVGLIIVTAFFAVLAGVVS